MSRRAFDRGSIAGVPGSQVRLAELVASMSLATDLGLGQPMEQVLRGNLTTQRYHLSDAERRELAIGLRFSTGLCLSLVIVALALQSALVVFALCGIGLLASFTERHRSTTCGTTPSVTSSARRRCRRLRAADANHSTWQRSGSRSWERSSPPVRACPRSSAAACWSRPARP
jgi:hypothetical protein